eukprot:8585490-Alexandrium_andersonii.AAC.1
MHPSGAPETTFEVAMFEVVSGVAQFKLRMPEAILQRRAHEQLSHLCRDSLGPNVFRGEEG